MVCGTLVRSEAWAACVPKEGAGGRDDRKRLRAPATVLNGQPAQRATDSNSETQGPGVFFCLVIRICAWLQKT